MFHSFDLAMYFSDDLWHLQSIFASILKGCSDRHTQVQHTETAFVDQDGANKCCQDKEHCDNNIMATVHREITAYVAVLVIILYNKNTLRMCCNVDWKHSLQLLAENIGLSIVVCVAAGLKQLFFQVLCHSFF